MTLLDFYTAGTVEYVGVLITAVFGAIGLLGLARDPKFHKHKLVLTSLWLVVTGMVWWAVSRIIGTEYLIVEEMKREIDPATNQSLYTIYQQQAHLDPSAVSNLTNVFAEPFNAWLYYGVPLLFVALMAIVWYILFPRKEAIYKTDPESNP